MIERTYNAARFNEIVNDPSVRPFVADVDGGVLDLSEKIDDRRNICLLGEYGAFLCLRYYAGCYEVHIQILKEGRGAWAYAFADAAAYYVFTATDCMELIGRIPENHSGARHLALGMGFKTVMMTQPDCCWHGEMQRANILSLTLQEWSARPLPQAVNRGRLFQARCGGRWEDERNKIIGVCVAMLDEGQTGKAVLWYNRAANAARWAPFDLLSFWQRSQLTSGSAQP